ncbi:hypothetical protein [Streptomyces roseus]|uniref:hypothetical protein n=1 Tax=Streptomyces roseus TaxID=66430 RepID=UPI00131DAEDF|nr:hypothetical protein [Streptomyces roseus]
MPAGLVLDGEFLVWDAKAGQLCFEGLQRRAVGRPHSTRSLAARLPAFHMASDVLLQQDGIETLAVP